METHRDHATGLMSSSGPRPQGLQTSFSAYFHSEILAFLLPPQQLPPLTVVYLEAGRVLCAGRAVSMHASTLKQIHEATEG